MNQLLTHPHRRKASLGLIVLSGALLFLVPEAGGVFGLVFLLAGLGVEGWQYIWREGTSEGGGE